MLAIKINPNGDLVAVRCICMPTAGPVEVQAASTAPVLSSPSRSSYGQILKSSAMVGGAQVANIVIGVVRTKTMAILLGPAGFGLFGLYGSIQNLTLTIAGMGINSSGIRQIAEAAGTGDKQRVAQTAVVLRRTAFVLGLLGALLLALFSRSISRLTFGTPDRASEVALLSIAIFFGSVSGGQGALIQGMRHIADLAKMNVLGTLLGLCSAVPLVYFLRQQGVVPSLVAVAGMGIFISWWYSRKIAVENTIITLSQVRQEAWGLLKLGTVFMASGLMMTGVAYAVRIMIVHRLGFEATGLYQSAWTLGGLYVGVILQAMGADFCPRLTASIHNHDEANRLVNEQTLIGLLLAGPGVLATLTFAPLVIALLYSAKFGAAVGVLRWICLGAAMQVITWPMGFIVVAKGRPTIFFLAELAWTVVAVPLSWVCVIQFGLNGAGIAFFGSYIFHWILIYPMARWLTGFQYSGESKKMVVVFLSVTGLVFCGFYALPLLWAVGIGTVTTVASSAYSMRYLAKLVPLEHFPTPIRRLFVGLGCVPSVSTIGL